MMQETLGISKKGREVLSPPVIEKAHIRWMVQPDLGQVRRIEKECFEYQWTEEDFSNCLRRRNCIGLVAEAEGEVVGFMIYEFTKRRINLLNLGVKRDARNRCFGSQLVRKLIRKLSRNGRTRISFTVRERNLPAQLFFKSLGFKAVEILHQFYEEAQEDAYIMEYHIPWYKSGTSRARQLIGK